MKKQVASFLFGSSLGQGRILNLGWLLFRLHIGLSIAIHAGFPKMKDIAAPGWFTEQVAGLGFSFPSPQFWAMSAAWGEFVGGILIALGLLTRLNALQLTFQFLVISFKWYNEPEFLTGMYFQQLYFWSFLFCAIAGGGTYSLDAAIRKRAFSSISLAKPVVASLLVLFMFKAEAQDAPVLKQEDIQKIRGSWTGNLTYKDYQSGKQVIIPCNLEVKLGNNKRAFSLSYSYPGESDHNTTDEIKVSEDGRKVNGELVTERTISSDSTLRVVVEARGQDNSKPAIIYSIIEISENKFTITKNVRYMTTGEVFERNRYSFSR
jgi:uncharacterized membrane protein YphA (DoxX/SURF4 family)